jgi:glycosyltransferase involved in cell wall biosynthesis
VFSILTACHNAAPYLDQCIRSVLDQTHSDFEWVFVDDCSTDGSADKIAALIDTRLHCSGAYRLALQHAKGEVCGVLDADDALHVNALALVLEAYRRFPKIGFIYTQHWWCNDKLKPVRRGLSSMPVRNLVDAASMRQHCFSHFRTFKRELANKAEIFPVGLMYSVDKNMGFVLEEVARGGFLSVPLYYYRFHKHNMSRTQAGNQKSTWFKLAEKRRQYRKKMGIVPFRIQGVSCS